MNNNPRRQPNQPNLEKTHCACFGRAIATEAIAAQSQIRTMTTDAKKLRQARKALDRQFQFLDRARLTWNLGKADETAIQHEQLQILAVLEAISGSGSPMQPILARREKMCRANQLRRAALNRENSLKADSHRTSAELSQSTQRK